MRYERVNGKARPRGNRSERLRSSSSITFGRPKQRVSDLVNWVRGRGSLQSAKAIYILVFHNIEWSISSLLVVIVIVIVNDVSSLHHVSGLHIQWSELGQALSLGQPSKAPPISVVRAHINVSSHLPQFLRLSNAAFTVAFGFISDIKYTNERIDRDV